MTIPKAMVVDLLPLYFEDEVSEESKACIEAYLSDHPQFAEQMKNEYELKKMSIPAQTDDGLSILQRTQKLLRVRSLLLAISLMAVVGAILFYTFYDFSITKGDGFHPIYWLGQITPFVAAVSIAGYVTTRYRLRTSGL